MVELPMDSRPRVRVNGALLSQFESKAVCIIGTVTKASSGGTAFQMKSSDNQIISVRLRDPITEPLSGLIEVYGVAQGKDAVVSASFTSFPDTVTSTFDLATHNEIIKLLHSMEGNPWLPSS